MSGAVLVEANARGAVMESARLTGADLTRTQVPNRRCLPRICPSARPCANCLTVSR